VAHTRTLTLGSTVRPNVFCDDATGTRWRSELALEVRLAGVHGCGREGTALPHPPLFPPYTHTRGTASVRVLTQPDPHFLTWRVAVLTACMQVRKLSSEREGLVFMLWGNFAKKKGKTINKLKHTVIESAHPSPLSARYWHGCKVFAKCNAALIKRGQSPIDWQLPADP
jgi:hypothetical protein